MAVLSVSMARRQRVCGGTLGRGKVMWCWWEVCGGTFGVNGALAEGVWRYPSKRQGDAVVVESVWR